VELRSERLEKAGVVDSLGLRDGGFEPTS